MSTSTSIPLAQSLALLTTTSLTGYIFSCSFLSIPTLLLTAPTSPHLTAQQWHALYNLGAATAPPAALLATASTAFLASTSYVPSLGLAGQEGRFWLYAAATLLAPAIAPFTLTAMASTNGALHGLAGGSEQQAEKRKGELVELLVRWRGLNYVRAGMVGLAAVCTVGAVVWC